MDSSTKERIRALLGQGDEREERERKKERKRRKREKEGEEERRKKNRKLSWRSGNLIAERKQRAEGGARLGKRTGPLERASGRICSD